MALEIDPDVTRWVTEEYAARSIGVSPRTLRRWWDEHGYGPTRYRVGPDGRLVRYLKDEVDVWTPEGDSKVAS